MLASRSASSASSSTVSLGGPARSRRSTASGSAARSPVLTTPEYPPRARGGSASALHAVGFDAVRQRAREPGRLAQRSAILVDHVAARSEARDADAHVLLRAHADRDAARVHLARLQLGQAILAC